MKDTKKIITGNYFNKYETTHFLYQLLMSNYRSTLRSLINELPIDNCLEIGSGEGYIIDYLINFKPDLHIMGSDIEYSMVRFAAKNQPFADWCVINGDNLPFRSNTYDLVLACEVLEHVNAPANVLRELHRVSCRYVIISVPYEPFWRILNTMRFKYLKDFGNTPGHINHWSKNSLKNLVEQFFQTINIRISFPWIFIEAVKL